LALFTTYKIFSEAANLRDDMRYFEIGRILHSRSFEGRRAKIKKDVQPINVEIEIWKREIVQLSGYTKNLLRDKIKAIEIVVPSFP
jgi:hypothetical protein